MLVDGLYWHDVTSDQDTRDLSDELEEAGFFLTSAGLLDLSTAIQNAKNVDCAFKTESEYE